MDLANRIREAASAVGSALNDINIKIGVNQGLRIALAVLLALLAGIFAVLLYLYANFSGLVQGSRWIPWLILIFALVVGIITYFVLGMQ